MYKKYINEKEESLLQLEIIPKKILELEFEIEKLKESYKIHKARFEEIVWEEQQEFIKSLKK